MENIVFYDNMDDFIKIAQNIDWFNNCGNKYAEEFDYNYILDDNLNTARDNATRIYNHPRIITVENLFDEGNFRVYSYLKNNKIEELHILEPLRKKAGERLNNEIDFNSIYKKYIERMGIKNNCDTTTTHGMIYHRIRHMLISAMVEKYYKNIISEIPVFFEKIIKIYKDGHIVTGWKGKFPPPNIFTDKAIDRKEGILLIW